MRPFAKRAKKQIFFFFFFNVCCSWSFVQYFLCLPLCFVIHICYYYYCYYHCYLLFATKRECFTWGPLSVSVRWDGCVEIVHTDAWCAYINCKLYVALHDIFAITRVCVVYVMDMSSFLCGGCMWLTTAVITDFLLFASATLTASSNNNNKNEKQKPYTLYFIHSSLWVAEAAANAHTTCPPVLARVHRNLHKQCIFRAGAPHLQFCYMLRRWLMIAKI